MPRRWFGEIQQRQDTALARVYTHAEGDLWVSAALTVLSGLARHSSIPTHLFLSPREKFFVPLFPAPFPPSHLPSSHHLPFPFGRDYDEEEEGEKVCSPPFPPSFDDGD